MKVLVCYTIGFASRGGNVQGDGIYEVKKLTSGTVDNIRLLALDQVRKDNPDIQLGDQVVINSICRLDD